MRSTFRATSTRGCDAVLPPDGPAPHQGGNWSTSSRRYSRDAGDAARIRPDVPRGLSHVVMRCLGKASGARFTDYFGPAPGTRALELGRGSPATLRTQDGRRPARQSPFDRHLLCAGHSGTRPTASSVERRAAWPPHWPIFFEHRVLGNLRAQWGATREKALVGLRVVKLSGGPPGSCRAIARSSSSMRRDRLGPGVSSHSLRAEYAAEPEPGLLIFLLRARSSPSCSRPCVAGNGFAADRTS